MNTLLDVTLEQIAPALHSSHVDVTIHVSSTLNVTAFTARQKLSGLALSKIGTGIGANEPQLIMSRNRILWRVPLFLALPQSGHLGEIGAIDIDAQTSEILADEATIESLIRNARQLAPNSAS
jgi:hypothetical protein